MWIKSNVIPNARWEIKRDILLISGNRVLKHNTEIIKTENDFIANYNPMIFCNDLSGKEWCFDKKLPSGGWLENIEPTWSEDGTRVFKATIMC